MLPEIRSELSLHPGPANADGSPTWTIRDPVRGSFFRISWMAFEMLLRWSAQTPEKIASAVAEETTLCPSEDDVKQLADFLIANQLTRTRSREDTQRLLTQQNAQTPSFFKKLLHNYLFFRIPLLHPNAALDFCLTWVRWLGSLWFRLLSIFAVIFGLILVQREWDQFVNTFIDTLTPSGFISYGIALGFVKVIHELAHAFSAKNFGCKVPTMGLAFLVLWPVLYTDVNDVWMLPERRKRLIVGSAGVVAELMVASWATLAWAFLPDGVVKQAAFMLAAITWISSLAINLSPFMRFDGYFLLMDAFEMPNLHPRSFAMARWWLREIMFRLGEAQPEPMPANKRHLLVLFAFLVWVYRLVLFLGVAVLVYHFFIKAVGILLFIVEIGWFVIMPIWNEIGEIKKRKDVIMRQKYSLLTFGLLSFLLILCFIPWQSQIKAPSVLKASQSTSLYLPFSAKLEKIHVHNGDIVEKGQLLMSFSSPSLDHQLKIAHARKQASEFDLETALHDPSRQENIAVLKENVSKSEAEEHALLAERDRLHILASQNGVLVDLVPDLQPGQFISQRLKLAIIRDKDRAIAVGYLSENDLARVVPDTEVTFIPSVLEFQRRSGTLSQISPSPIKALKDDMLSSLHKGDIASFRSQNLIITEQPLTRISVTLTGQAPSMEMKGVLLLQGKTQSLVTKLFRSIMIVLVREWGA